MPSTFAPGKGQRDHKEDARSDDQRSAAAADSLQHRVRVRLRGGAELTLRRLRYLAAFLGIAAALTFSLTWVLTPGTAAVIPLANHRATAHGGLLLGTAHIPKTLVHAVVAIEDSQFFQDAGIDLEGVIRAGVYDLVHFCGCQGGSTLTDQLAEDIYMQGNDSSVWGRWVDTVLALKIAQHTSKMAVLAAYLNEVYLGQGAYGVRRASLVYFHRALAKDTLAQFAMLAGLPQAPSALDPLTHPEAARERRAAVLAQMRADGYISAVAEKRAMAARV